MLYANKNATTTYTVHMIARRITGFRRPMSLAPQIQNLFPPYETYNLSNSLSSYNNDRNPPYFGSCPDDSTACLEVSTVGVVI